jgi:ribonuclease P/MRP protein subunit RPP25
MDQYLKGKNVEEELTTANIPVANLPPKFGWLLVSGSTKIRTALGPATRQFKEEGCLVIAGSGNSTSKAVSIAEILKRRNKSVHQITKIGVKKVEEHWDPKSDELDPLVVTREIPTIHLVLFRNDPKSDPETPKSELTDSRLVKPDSQESEFLKSDTLGYQGPSFVLESLWKTEPLSGKRKPQRKNNPRGRKNADELGLSNANAKGNNVGKQGEKNRNKNGQKYKDHQPRNKDGNVHQNKEKECQPRSKENNVQQNENKNKNKVSVESKTDACANIMENTSIKDK